MAWKELQGCSVSLPLRMRAESMHLADRGVQLRTRSGLEGPVHHCRTRRGYWQHWGLGKTAAGQNDLVRRCIDSWRQDRKPGVEMADVAGGAPKHRDWQSQHADRRHQKMVVGLSQMSDDHKGEPLLWWRLAAASRWIHRHRGAVGKAANLEEVGGDVKPEGE